jgi:hypothetical protein
MVGALLLAGVLFIVQTWVAALLVPDAPGLLANGDPEGTAFYDAARAAGGGWLAGHWGSTWPAGMTASRCCPLWSISAR